MKGHCSVRERMDECRLLCEALSAEDDLISIYFVFDYRCEFIYEEGSEDRSADIQQKTDTMILHEG